MLVIVSSLVKQTAITFYSEHTTGRIERVYQVDITIQQGKCYDLKS